MMTTFRRPVLLVLPWLAALGVACGGGSDNKPAESLAQASPTVEAFTGGPSSHLQLTGLIAGPATFKLVDLQALPTSNVATDAAAGSGRFGEDSYVGPPLYDLLQETAIRLDPNQKNDILTKAVVAVGADGYGTLGAGGEVHSKFGNVQVLIAIARDGQPLADSDGFARVVVPGDGLARRYVSKARAHRGCPALEGT
jgi:DMSO/TMAO reductase YedYZ molybdopterin-dependent catalytic subunit